MLRKKRHPNAEEIEREVELVNALGREREQTLARLFEIEVQRRAKLTRIEELRGE